MTERRHKDGHRIPVSVTISPVRDAAGRIVGASKIARDATMVVEAERSGSRYSLRLPSQFLPPGRGAEHRHACLRALALMPEAEARHD